MPEEIDLNEEEAQAAEASLETNREALLAALQAEKAERQGRAWWKQNGCDLHDAVFKTKPGSSSRIQMDAYVAERAARKKG